MEDFDFSSEMAGVAKHFYGEENKQMSKPGVELRFGKQGSVSVDLKKGTFYDNEAKEGGGVLALIYQKTGQEDGKAIQWLRDNGFNAPERKGGGEQKQKRKIVKTYDYSGIDGEVVFQVCRWEPKTFTQRRAYSEEGVFVNGLNAGMYMRKNGGNWSRYNKENYEKWGCTETKSFPDIKSMPLYNAAQVKAAIDGGQEIFYPEGEKDADRITAAGYPSTTNAGGSAKWRDEYGKQLKGAHVVLIADNDEAGRNHVQVTGRHLKPHVASVKVLHISDMWADCPEKGDLSDWADAGGDVASLGDYSDRYAKDWEKEPLASTMNAIEFGSVTAMSSPHQPLIKRFLTRKEIAVLYAESGMGKSFLSLEIAMSVALGREYRGMKTRQGLVVYQAGEGGAGIQRRIAAYKQHNDISGDIPAVLIPQRINLLEEKSVDAFIKEIKAQCENHSEHKLELVLIDTWAKATLGANEVSAQDVTKALKGVEKIQSACDTAVLLVHHTNASGERMKGNSVLPAAVETTITIIDTERREEATSEYGNKTIRTVRRAFVVKQKEGEAGNGFDFVLKQVRLGEDEDGDPITSCVCVTPENTVGDNDKKQLTTQQFVAMKALINALVEKGEAAPYNSKVVEGITKVVRMRHWRACFDELTFIADEDEKTRKERTRKALQRAGESFMQKGYIGKTDPYVFLTQKSIPGFKSEDLHIARKSDQYSAHFDDGADTEIPF